MISRPLPHTFETQFSFTIDDYNLKLAVKILTELKQIYPDLKFSICASNSKISIVSDNIQKSIILSNVLEKFCALNIEILLLSATEQDVSLLVSNTSILTAEYALKDINNE